VRISPLFKGTPRAVPDNPDFKNFWEEESLHLSLYEVERLVTSFNPRKKKKNRSVHSSSSRVHEEGPISLFFLRLKIVTSLSPSYELQIG
jgi:hypothetical protein